LKFTLAIHFGSIFTSSAPTFVCNKRPLNMCTHNAPSRLFRLIQSYESPRQTRAEQIHETKARIWMEDSKASAHALCVGIVHSETFP